MSRTACARLRNDGRQRLPATRPRTANGERRPCRAVIPRPSAVVAVLPLRGGSYGHFPVGIGLWRLPIRRLPGYRATAVSTLTQAPDSVRPALFRQLAEEADFPARRLEADLRARWGDPRGALETLQGSLPEDRGQALEALRGLLDQVRFRPSRDARVATGRILELIAERSSESERARLRLEAARAMWIHG